MHQHCCGGRHGIVPLCSAMGQHYLESWGRFGEPQHKKDINLSEKRLREGYKDGEESGGEAVGGAAEGTSLVQPRGD